MRCLHCDCEMIKGQRESKRQFGTRKFCSRACAAVWRGLAKLITEEEALQKAINLAVRSPSGCLELTSGTSSDRYPRIWFNGRKEAAHRVVFRKRHGRIPDGMRVLHRCDNTCCIEESHLFQGTDQDNVDDKVRKGRQPRGMQCASSVLTDDDVRKIRDDARSSRRIGRDYGVSYKSILRIKNRTGWTHVI